MNSQAIYQDQKKFLVGELQSAFNQAIYISDSDIKPFFITFYTRFNAYLESISCIWPDDSSEHYFFVAIRCFSCSSQLKSFQYPESSSRFVAVVESLLKELQS